VILRSWDTKAKPPVPDDVNGYGFFPVMFGYERRF
jgi:hypothetical protein